MEEVLIIKDLVVKYITDKSVVDAVNGISFDLKKGETLGLVGETGAGKTTTALSVMGLLPTPAGQVKEGHIIFEGQDLLELKDKEMDKIRGRKISMIYQDPMTSLNPTMTVGRQISEVLITHNICKKEEVVEKTAEMLELVGIPRERADEYPHQFSGGMKQRVVIAMALACRPQLLIADEPTTALDVTIQAQVLEMMKELRDELGTSMILITHDLGIVGETCDKVAIMYAGEIIESGDIEEVFNNPKHPYTIGLMGSVPDVTKRTDRLTPIMGLMPDPTDLPQGCNFCPRCTVKKDICETEEAEAYYINDTHMAKCHIRD